MLPSPLWQCYGLAAEKLSIRRRTSSPRPFPIPCLFFSCKSTVVTYFTCQLNSSFYARRRFLAKTWPRGHKCLPFSLGFHASVFLLRIYIMGTRKKHFPDTTLLSFFLANDIYGGDQFFSFWGHLADRGVPGYTESYLNQVGGTRPY